MYNFELTDGEEIIDVFDNIWICQGENEKNTTIALTNKRLLFMEFDKFDPNETIRIGRGVDYVRYKEVYYKINLDEIVSIENKDYYTIQTTNNLSFSFDDEKLYKLLTKN